MEKKVTPKIKRTRVHTERYDVCPHCKEEIREKASYVDPEGYEYHRQCHDKGPIGKIDLGAKFGIDGFSIPESKTSNVKTAGGLPTERRSGFLEKNVAGKDYQIPWDGTITPSVKDGSQDSVIAEQPANMPEDLWAQIQAIANDEAKKAARKDLTKASVKAAVIQKSANWLDRACLTVVADKAKPAGPSKKNFADVDGPSEDEDEDDDGHHVTAAMKGKPIDETLLADGLGAFLDVFVNYHTGKEGDKLAKWVIEICKDPKYAEVAGKLQEFHKLMGDIYKDVVEIANEDESVRGKVAGVLKRVKTAANRYPLASEFVDALRYEDDKVSDVVIDLILSRYDWTEIQEACADEFGLFAKFRHIKFCKHVGGKLARIHFARLGE